MVRRRIAAGILSALTLFSPQAMGGAIAERRSVVEEYRLLLGRAPNEEELHAVSALRSRAARLSRLLDSDEFRARVDDASFLAGLYEQTRGRLPSAHEMTIGLHFLEEGVPRSEVLGRMSQSGRRMIPLDFRSKLLTRYRRQSSEWSRQPPHALHHVLESERRSLGGAEPGPARREGIPDGPEPIYDVYYGYLHAHTRVSLDARLQGSEGPYAAFEYARNVAGLDFLGLSDHAEFISTRPWNNEWRLLKRAADAYNENGTFVALRGFEYSNPIYGHINVFGTERFVSAFAAVTLPLFYAWLSHHPDAAATFNHPGQVDGLHVEFLHFDHFPAVHDQMAGIELLTHDAEYERYSVGYVSDDGLGHMDEAIRSGWEIGSVSAQDNHSGGWGTIDEYRTGVLAQQLTREEILDAVRQRRFFSTQDRNLRLSFRTDGREMGAHVGPGPRTFVVTLDDGDGEGFCRIDLYRNGTVIESRAVAGSGSFDFDVGEVTRRSWYYVRVTQEDGDQAQSAPIWVDAPAP